MAPDDSDRAALELELYQGAERNPNPRWPIVQFVAEFIHSFLKHVGFEDGR